MSAGCFKTYFQTWYGTMYYYYEAPHQLYWFNIAPVATTDIHSQRDGTHSREVEEAQ